MNFAEDIEMGVLNPENPQDQDDEDSDPGIRELEGMIQCLLNFKIFNKIFF